jgi:hypothetical protein
VRASHCDTILGTDRLEDLVYLMPNVMFIAASRQPLQWNSLSAIG